MYKFYHHGVHKTITNQLEIEQEQERISREVYLLFYLNTMQRKRPICFSPLCNKENSLFSCILEI